MAGKVNFSILRDAQNTSYIGDKNDPNISNYNAHYNTYFNIDVAQAAYFTMLIEGFEYSRFHSSITSDTRQMKTTQDQWNNGLRDRVWSGTQIDKFNGVGLNNSNSTRFDNFTKNGSIYWLPLKSLKYSQGAIDNMTIACGAFADIQLPFRKKSPTLDVEMYDHRSDFFEMKLREWHSQSVVTGGYVPVLESIAKKVHIRSYATNGEVNSYTVCDCILGGDITTSRSYEEDGLKVISFQLVVVGY